MRQFYPQLAALNAVVVAISSDSLADAVDLASRLELPFPLLSDATLEVIKAYGVYHADEPRGRQISRVAEFIIDRSGVIRYSYGGRDYNDRSGIPSLLQVLSQREADK